MNKENSSPIFKGIALALIIIFLFSAGFMTGSVGRTDEAEATSTAQPSTARETVPVAVTTTVPSTTASSETTSAAAQSETTAAAGETTTAVQTPSGEKTTAEIVQIFNESANRVKGEATKVVKNYEHRNVDTDKLVAPAILQGTAETLIPKFMKDDTEPIEYATAQDIRDNYQVPKQDYVSMLTEADVERATFKDNGTEYEIEIEVKDEENPVAGTGVGSCFDVIETSEVSEAVDFVKNFSTKYFDCTVKCKIDKATGRMTWANYTTPLTLDVTVNLLGTHDASITMSFEKDYVITY